MLNSRNLKLFLPFLLLAFFLDQASKLIVVNTLNPFQPPVNIIGSLLRFRLTYNPYGVFSLSFGPPAVYFVLQIIGIIVLGYVALTMKDRPGMIVFGIIVGGAFGNLFDRFRVNYVIDFIDMGIGNARWFVYNLADAFITVGALFLLTREFIFRKPPAGKPKDDTAHS